MCTMHMVMGEVQVELLISDSIINLRKENKPHKYKSIFHVSKITYKTRDTERNTTQDKHSIEYLDHIIKINAITDSRFCSHPYDCS